MTIVSRLEGQVFAFNYLSRTGFALSQEIGNDPSKPFPLVDLKQFIPKPSCVRDFGATLAGRVHLPPDLWQIRGRNLGAQVLRAGCNVTGLVPG